MVGEERVAGWTVHRVSVWPCYVIQSNRKRINRAEGVSPFSNHPNSVNSSFCRQPLI